MPYKRPAKAGREAHHRSATGAIEPKGKCQFWGGGKAPGSHSSQRQAGKGKAFCQGGAHRGIRDDNPPSSHRPFRSPSETLGPHTLQ